MARVLFDVDGALADTNHRVALATSAGEEQLEAMLQAIYGG